MTTTPKEVQIAYDKLLIEIDPLYGGLVNSVAICKDEGGWFFDVTVDSIAPNLSDMIDGYRVIQTIGPEIGRAEF